MEVGMVDLDQVGVLLDGTGKEGQGMVGQSDARRGGNGRVRAEQVYWSRVG